MFQHFQTMKANGTMDGAYFVSRQELLAYVNAALNTNEYIKVEQCGNGVAYLLMLHDILTSLAHAESLLAPPPSQQRPYHPPPPAPLPPGSPMMPFTPAPLGASGSSAFDGWHVGSSGTAGGAPRTPMATAGGAVVSVRAAAAASSLSAAASGSSGGKPSPLLALASAIMARMKKRARSEFEATHNLKLLQDMLGRLGVQRTVEVDKLARGVYQSNLEFLQWFVRFAKNAKANEEAVLMQQSYPQQAAAIAATTASATRAASAHNPGGASPSGGSTFRQPQSPSERQPRSVSAFALEQQPHQSEQVLAPALHHPPPPFRPQQAPSRGGSAGGGAELGSSISSMPTLHAGTVAFAALDHGATGADPLSGRLAQTSSSGLVSHPTSGRPAPGPGHSQQQGGGSFAKAALSGRAHSVGSSCGNYTDPVNPVVTMMNGSTTSAPSTAGSAGLHGDGTCHQLGSRPPPPGYQSQQRHAHHHTPPSVQGVASVPPPAHVSATVTTYHTDSISIDGGGIREGGGLFSASSSADPPLNPPAGFAGRGGGLLFRPGCNNDDTTTMDHPQLVIPGNVEITVEEGVPAPHRPPLLHQHGQARRALNAEAATALQQPQQQQQQLRGNRSPSGRSARSGSARSPSPSSPMGLGALQTTTGVTGPGYVGIGGAPAPYVRNPSGSSGLQRNQSVSGSPRTNQQHLLNRQLFVGGGGAVPGTGSAEIRRGSVDYVGDSVGLRSTSLDLVGEPPAVSRVAGRVASTIGSASINLSFDNNAVASSAIDVACSGVNASRGPSTASSVAAPSSTSATSTQLVPPATASALPPRSAVALSLFGSAGGGASVSLTPTTGGVVGVGPTAATSAALPPSHTTTMSLMSHSYQMPQPPSLHQQTILSDDGDDMLVMSRPSGVARSPVPHAAVAPRPQTGASSAATVAAPAVAALPVGSTALTDSCGHDGSSSAMTTSAISSNPPTVSGGSVAAAAAMSTVTTTSMPPPGADPTIKKGNAAANKAAAPIVTPVVPPPPMPRRFVFEETTSTRPAAVDVRSASTTAVASSTSITTTAAVGSGSGVPVTSSTTAAASAAARSGSSTLLKSAPPPPALSTISTSSAASQQQLLTGATAASPVVAPPPTASDRPALALPTSVPIVTPTSTTAEIQARFYYDKLRAIELLVCDPQRAAALCGSSIGVVAARPLLAEITKILHASS